MRSPVNASPIPSRASAHDFGVDAVRYSFIVMDLHHLLLAGLPAHSALPPKADSTRTSRQVREVPNNGSHFKQAMPSRATDRASSRLHFGADLRNQREGCPDDRDPSDRCPGKASGSRPQPWRLPHSVLSIGDIGTSTLYGLKQAVEAAGAPTPDTVMGVVSLILWALLLIVALKYAILILRADNHGEGGIVALLALLDARRAPRGSWRASLLIVGLVGAALLYGDGVITPAISVLSAVEGLKIDAPGLAPRSFLSPSQSWRVCSWSSAGERSSSAASSGR